MKKNFYVEISDGMGWIKENNGRHAVKIDSFRGGAVDDLIVILDKYRSKKTLTQALDEELKVAYERANNKL